MTRKRNREDLTRMMYEACPYCHGEGVVKSRRTICYEIFRKIARNAENAGGELVTVKVNPQVAAMMLNEEATTIANLEEEIKKKLSIVSAKSVHSERYEIVWKA